MKLKNTASANIKVTELVRKETVLAPGEELEINPATQVIEVSEAP